MQQQVNDSASLHRPQRDSGKTQAAFFVLRREEDLEHAMLSPCRWLIEIDQNQKQLHPTPFSETRGNQLFALSITGRSAYQFSVAAIAIQHFQQMGWFSNTPCENIETCLHEAILNAIVHGNLEIGGGFDNHGNLLQFYNMVQQRLDNPYYGERRIHIILSRMKKRLYLRVSQSGSGYAGHQPQEQHSPHGRGLEAIRQLAASMQWLHHGRTLEMSFE